jgi:integrase
MQRSRPAGYLCGRPDRTSHGLSGGQHRPPKHPIRRAAPFRLRDWLADPDHRIPVHATPHARKLDTDGEVNWSLLTLLLGWRRGLQASTFGDRRAAGRRRVAQVRNAIATGHRTTRGVVDDLAHVRHGDGTSGPWHPGLSPTAIRHERLVLRNACFVLVVGLSMMRDSEIHEIGPGALVEHYGTPAIASTKHKRDPNLPTKHWWITEPVAEAITVAEQLSTEPDRIFTPLRRPDADVARSHQMIDAFIAHVNATRAVTGLDEIPAGRVRPHMFRRTMAMLTDEFAGSEIALGIQLKHIATSALANRSTQGYTAADTAWADHLDTAIEAARFRRLEDLYRTHKTGGALGYGPAAARMAQVFDNIHDTVQARGGDTVVERALLLKARISIRFGSFNHCAFDERSPAGAVCLDNATVPPGHNGPLPDRCRPDRCPNSVIGPEHVPIWRSQQRALLTLIDTLGLPPCRTAVLQRELTEVQALLDKADKGKP